MVRPTRKRNYDKARACRDHHGRKRTLGQGARHAAACRPSRRRRGAAQDGARRARPRHLLPDRLRLLVGKLVAAEVRSQRPDGPAETVHPPRSRRTAPERRAGQDHRRQGRAAVRHQGSARRGRIADRPQRGADTGHRLQLWRTRRDRAHGAQACRGRGARRTRQRGDHGRVALPALSTRKAFPDPELVIRTSGELRLSNFLLWQAAYSELVFLPCYWPDFSREHLADALRDFAGRERRFGGLAPQDVASRPAEG